MLAEIIAGSKLYGLNNAQSDTDYRGIFTATNKRYVAGFDKCESIVQTGEVDSAYYELGRYLAMLRKTNTQVLEILFAPDESFTYITDIFKEIRANKLSLIDSHVLKASLKGYVFSEIKLATGERSGRLGGKRKEAVTTFGFSPKNFVQILRLCKVGTIFFERGEYMVKVKDFDPAYHTFLMDIKNSPEGYSCEKLKELVDEEYKKLEESIEKSTVSFKFDVDLAADLVIKARNGK